MCVSSQSIIINKSSYTSRPHALGASTLAQCIKHSQLCCVKQSQFYCVGNHEQPLVGESLFASTGPAGQALSPPS